MKLILKGLIFCIIIFFSIKLTKSYPIKIDICSRNPIFCQIVRNNPAIDKTYAMKLSNVIYSIAKLYDIDSKKYTAILAQESLYRLGAINHKSKDYSIGQINIKTIIYYKLDKNKLLTDLEYSIKSSMKILSDLKNKYGDKETNYWSRYHSFKKEDRKKYEKLVNKYEL